MNAAATIDIDSKAAFANDPDRPWRSDPLELLRTAISASPGELVFESEPGYLVCINLPGLA